MNQNVPENNALTFHPVKESRPDSWFPGNEAAQILVQADHVWEDIGVICKIYHLQNDQYSRKLLMKYVVIEICSIIDLIDALQMATFKAPISSVTHLSRSLLPNERASAEEIFKAYGRMKKDHQSQITRFRNEFGAHRKNKDWKTEKTSWESLTPIMLDPILKVIHQTIQFARRLDLYEWNRSHEDGSFEILGPRYDFRNLFSPQSDDVEPK